MSENTLDSHIRDVPVSYLKRTLQIASAQGYHTADIMKKFELDAKTLSMLAKTQPSSGEKSQLNGAAEQCRIAFL